LITGILLGIGLASLAISAVALLMLPDLRTRLRVAMDRRELATKVLASEPFSSRIATEPWASGLESERAREAIKWVRARVRSYGPEPTSEPAALLAAVEAGAPAICSGMTILARAVLAAAGLESRTVLLRRNLFDPFDAHSTVEVRLDEGWSVVDPTFGVIALGPQDRWLSAQEIHDEIVRGASIRWDEIAPGAYPVRLRDYYIDVDLLFNNVLVVDPASARMARYVPPLRFYFGPGLRVEDRSPQDSGAHFRAVAHMQFISLVALPVLGVVALVLAAVLWIMRAG
jgi:hypothetical protein